ncbi:MAG TPA: hypothetical protein PK559_06445, partial [Ignavibacteriaceae bacterium]|nr:hypothetical protein [Ignavibacteriaceae bacterium]
MNKNLHRLYIGSFVVVGFSSFIFLLYNGFDYYRLSMEVRPFSDEHNLLKPSGIIGHGLGIIGSIMMISGVVIYMSRKRFKFLSRIGYLKHWLEFHIFLCSVGPLLILFHTAFKFGGIVAISFWSMIAVVISGVIGRFIYIQIPRTMNGEEANLNQLEADYNKKLIELNLPPLFLNDLDTLSSERKFKSVTISNSMILIIKDFFFLRNYLKSIRKKISIERSINKSEAKILSGLLKNKLILERRISILSTMKKLFGYWHIFHLPFAII